MYAQRSSSGDLVVPNVIKGEKVSLPDTQNFPVIQGSTGDTVHYAQSATVEVARSAVDAAAETFKSWKKTPVNQRRELLNRVASILERKVEEATKREMLETSCNPHWPANDIKLAASFIRETAASASSVCGSIPPSDDTKNTSLVFKEPVGVVLCIPP